MFSTDRNYAVSFSETQFNQATGVHPDGKEDVFYCLASGSETGGEKKELVRRVLNPYEFEVERSAASVEPSPEFVCRLYNVFGQEKASTIIQIHWHKFCVKPEFSDIDHECAFSLLEDAKKINPRVRVVQIVFGRNSQHFKARYLKAGRFVYFDDIEIIGPNGIRILSSKGKPERKLDTKGIFEKNVLAFTKEGAGKIGNAKIAVVGAGGTGSGLLYQAVRVGFQCIRVIDPDTISTDNCNRLYFVEKPKRAVRKFKARFMTRAAKRFNPKAKISYYVGDARDDKTQELLKGADLIILAVDNDAIRAVVNSFCSRHCKPLVNIGTGIFMNEEGTKIKNAGTQIQWFIPREPDYPCLRCQGSLNQTEIQKALISETQKENRRKAGYISNTGVSPEPQVMPLNGIGISLAMWQVCCWIAGVKNPDPWTYYDAVQNKIINMQVRQNPGCSCCGLNELSILALGDYREELTKRKGEEEKS